MRVLNPRYLQWQGKSEPVQALQAEMNTHISLWTLANTSETNIHMHIYLTSTVSNSLLGVRLLAGSYIPILFWRLSFLKVDKYRKGPTRAESDIEVETIQY